MSDNKKYYYLKLKDNFYDSEEMIILQNMPDGYLYSDILLKLYLRSLRNGGRLMFKDVIPYTPQVLSQVVRHQVGTVEKSLQIFQQLGLIEVLDNGAIYMADIQNFIGESSTEADRIRNYRKKIKLEEVTRTNVQLLNDKTTPEIELEIEKDINNIYGQNDLGQVGQNNKNDPKEERWKQQFEEFYSKYPRKVKKQNVEKWFKKNKPSSELFSSMMNGLEQFRGSDEWKKDKGQFIPYPITWLNQRRWEDEEVQKKISVNLSVRNDYQEIDFNNLTDEQYQNMVRGDSGHV